MKLVTREESIVMISYFFYYLDTFILGKTSAIKRTDYYDCALVTYAIVYLDHFLF